MKKKLNKKTRSISALIMFGLFGIMIACSSNSEPKVNVSINVDKSAPDAADGFNLEQFHRLLLEEKPASGEWDAQFLSELVNREDINNLDLNQDGIVDDILIEPFGGDDNVGFQLYVKLKDEEGTANDEEQTICTVAVEKESENTGSLNVSGNEQIYGSNCHYHSGGMGIGSYLMLAWMMSPRYSMMGGGYGGYGGGRRVVSQTTYNKNINDRNTNHTGTKAPSATRSSTAPASIASAKQKTASNVKAGLKKPTSTQRQFQTQQKAKQSASGFAKKSSGTSKSTSAGRSSSARSRGGK